MNKTDTEIIRLRLDKLFSQNYFDVQDVDWAGRILGINVHQHANYNKLRALHCVDYNKMSQALKVELRNMVLDVLNMTPILMMAQPEPEAVPVERSWFQKLLR